MLSERVRDLFTRGVDMATVTIVLRSEGYDREITEAYQEVCPTMELVIEKGLYFYRPLDS